MTNNGWRENLTAEEIRLVVRLILVLTECEMIRMLGLTSKAYENEMFAGQIQFQYLKRSQAHKKHPHQRYFQ